MVPMAQKVVANMATSTREGLWIEPRALLPTCRILTRYTHQYYSLIGHSGVRRFLFLLLNETSVPHAQGPFEPIIATDVTAHYNTRRREVIVLGGELHVCQLYLWLFFVSSMAPFFEVIVFLIFEPLGVDFELSS